MQKFARIAEISTKETLGYFLCSPCRSTWDRGRASDVQT